MKYPASGQKRPDLNKDEHQTNDDRQYQTITPAKNRYAAQHESQIPLFLLTQRINLTELSTHIGFQDRYQYFPATTLCHFQQRQLETYCPISTDSKVFGLCMRPYQTSVVRCFQIQATRQNQVARSH